MIRTKILVIGICCLLASASAQAGQREPTSKKNREKVVKLATQLETEPLSKKAKNRRREVLTLIGNAPDLRVAPCNSILGELLLSKKLGAQELMVQLSISAAAFLSGQPQPPADASAAYVAGLEGVLRTYKAMRSANPLVQIDFVEELATKQARGELGDYVRAAMGECQ